ncbi:hypothetical protein [Methyloversatilis sp.]|uniref:hypothetical protein n=1 Tax=Methyloversatilis sp. TaxID=2569862 RepID=UPI0035B0F350
MSILRQLLATALLLLALSLVGAGSASSSDAPEQCATCSAFSDSTDLASGVYAVLMHRLDLAGDPPDPFVAEPARAACPHARPALTVVQTALLQPEPARVPLRPPRRA